MSRRRGRGRLTGSCRWCGQDVLWLTHPGTGKSAPIEPSKQPGGNIAADLQAGTYQVLTGADRDAADATFTDLDAQPSLRVPHRVVCTNLTRRLAVAAPVPSQADVDAWQEDRRDFV